MAPTVKMLRQDGSSLDVTPEEAQKLKVLGYREEAPVERDSRIRETAAENYYTSSDQQLATAGENLLSGGTLGLSNYLLADEDMKQRAKYNPGIAAAAEITGVALGAAVTGSPVNLVERGAARSVVGAGVGSAAARAGLAGGVIGGALETSHAYVSGDPITAESILHSVGWNALFSAGMGAAGAALSSRGASNAARGAEMEAIATRQLTKQATPGAFASATEPAYAGFRAEAAKLADELKASIKTTDAILSNNRRAIRELGFDRAASAGDVGAARIELQAAANKANKAMNKAGFNEARMEKALSDYESTVAKVYNKVGLTATDSGKQALKEHFQLQTIQKELSRTPRSAEAFAAMNPQRAEALFAAMDRAKTLSAFPTLGKAVDAQASKIQEALGLTPNGVSGLRKAWEQGRVALKAEKAAVAISTETASASIPRKIAAWAAGAGTYKAVAATGHPLMALGAAGRVRSAVLRGGSKTPELLAARNATLGRIKQAVGKYQAAGGKAITRFAPKIEPLTRRLDGSIDNTTSDKSQLAKNRVTELAEASTHIKDTLYRAIEPIAVEQPELGPALHQAGVSAFTALRSMMPADPGVVSGLKSIWKPSSLQAAVMSRQISVFQDPVGVAEEMLFTGMFDPIAVKAMKEISPATYQHMRSELIERVQEPGFLESMQYRDQVALGSLMDIPIHSSMKPEYIAASQAMHMTRNQPLPTPAIPGSSNGGRPAADTPGATAAQITTSR